MSYPQIGTGSPEEQLLILMSFSDLNQSESELVYKLADKVESWQTFLDLAKDNTTAPLIYYNLKKCNLLERLPKTILSQFEEITDKIRDANEARLIVARKFIKRFSEQNVPVVILKGILFAETIYNNPYYKKMNDIDILIKQTDMDKIFDIYEEMKFFSAAELVGGNPRKQKKFSHHAPPFFSRDLKCMIGTHWGLINPLSPYKPDYDAIWSRVVDFNFYEIPVKSLSCEDNLHHLCFHLPYYKTGLKELADIYNLIRHYSSKINWDILREEIKKAKTEPLVYHALSLVNKIYATEETVSLAQELEPFVPFTLKHDILHKSRNLSIILRSRCVHMSRIEKAYSDFNMTKRPDEMWRAYGKMWSNILSAPDEDVIKMNAIEKPNKLKILLGRLGIPLRIVRVFSFDLGFFIFVAILLKCAFEASSQTLLVPFNLGEPPLDFSDYLEKLGLTKEAVEKLKEVTE